MRDRSLPRLSPQHTHEDLAREALVTLSLDQTLLR